MSYSWKYPEACRAGLQAAVTRGNSMCMRLPSVSTTSSSESACRSRETWRAAVDHVQSAMKVLKHSILMAAVLCVGVSQALASEMTGKLVYVIVRDADGLIYVAVDGPRTPRPACAQGDYFMVKDENSATGKRTYAALLAAKVAGKTVHIWGAHSCTRWPDGEDIHAVQVLD